jgi:hypothetical protein
MAGVMPAVGDDGRVMTSGRQASARIPLTIRFEPILLDELRRRAEHAHLSLSQVVTLLVAEALRAGVEHDHGALIEQVISRTLEQRLWRVEALVRRVAVDAAQAKKLAYAAFTQADGVDLELARRVRDRVRRDAWTDLHTALPDDFPMDEPAASPGEE